MLLFRTLIAEPETSNITERYTLIEELKTWTEAQQYCREHHTDLVSIKNASENEEIVKKAQGKPFWIGLFNEPWKWSHQGDNYTFHTWSNGEPNSGRGEHNCVLMSKTGGWTDTGCNDQNSFFCCEELQDLGHLGFEVHNVSCLPGTLPPSCLRRWGATAGGLRIGDVQQGVLGQVMEEGLWGFKSRQQSGHRGRGARPRGPLQPSFLHPGLKSCTDAAGYVPLGSQGGMLHVQAPRTEGMSILLRDICIALQAVQGWNPDLPDMVLVL
ncbi:UNVERIFIED_CONTAM: hypothetical protein FKN15_037245 [Acipenser sinensis]